MNIDNRISFTSHIKFVDRKTMDIIQNCTGRKNRIFQWSIPDKSAYLLNKSKAATQNVRSCTGGFVIDAEADCAAIAMHIQNTDYNLHNIDIIKNLMKGTNAFFAGAKSHFASKKFLYSSEIMQYLVKSAKNKNLKTTYMRGLDMYCGIDMAYWGERDTIFLEIHKILPKKKGLFDKEHIDVKDFSHLTKLFESIRIASCDDLEFGAKISSKDLIDYYIS